MVILSRDGKVLKPYRVVKFADQDDVMSTDQNMEFGNEKGYSETTKASMGDATHVSSVTHVSIATQVTSMKDPSQPVNTTVESANIGDNGKPYSAVGS